MSNRQHGRGGATPLFGQPNRWHRQCRCGESFIGSAMTTSRMLDVHVACSQKTAGRVG